MKAVFAGFEGSEDATCDGVCRILGLLLPFELVVRELMVFVDADLLFVGFVSLCKFCRLIFSPCDASVEEGTLLLCQEPKGVADVFLGGLFFHSFLCCLHSIVIVKSFRWAWCISDVGGESGIFVGGNMYKAVQCRLSSVIFVSFLSPYLYPFIILRAPTPSFVAGCATVTVAATVAVS